MRRREFITLLGGAAVTWPLGASAQQPERVRRIVFLHGLAKDDPEAQARVAAFRQGLDSERMDRKPQHSNRTSVFQRRFRPNPR